MCIFCNIVEGKEHSYKIWENESHMAFLSIFPNTKGFTVVVPKKHYGSYCFEMPNEELCELILASKTVSSLLERTYKCRIGLIMEGFGINHAHIKLIPMHGTKITEWSQINSSVNTFFNKYEGYISSNNSSNMAKEEIEQEYKLIINHK